MSTNLSESPTEDTTLTVSGRPVIAGVVSVTAAAVSVAYASRVPEAGWFSALVALLFAALAGVWLLLLLDARTPRLAVDAHGVRLRFAREWVGFPWSELDGLSVESRSRLRDGRIIAVGADPESLAGLGRLARLYAGTTGRLLGSPFAVSVGWTSAAAGDAPDLASAVLRLSGSAPPSMTPVDLDLATPEPQPIRVRESLRERLPDPRPRLAAGIGTLASLIDRPREVMTARLAPIANQAGPDTSHARAEARHGDDTEPIVFGANALELSHSSHTEPLDLPEIAELRRPEPELADLAPSEEVTHVINFAPSVSGPGTDQHIGPPVAAARLRLSLSVDQLSERTRIRPHVIEAIEAEDFGPCGGDFYARGHLRTLSRVLGIDAAPLLTAYDEDYAQAEIDARQVFQADLARQGSLRTTRGGRHWSVLVAAVMAMVLVWSIARLLMDTQVEIHQPAPILNGSAGPNNATASTADPVSVRLTAARGVRVVVRDGGGTVAFRGNLAIDETKVLEVVPPVRISATDGAALTVNVGGQAQGALGGTEGPANETFLAPDEATAP